MPIIPQDINFIIDFDSTFIKLEGLDELARISLQDDPNRNEKFKEIQEVTKLGMEGKLTFPQSLNKRLLLFKTNKKYIQTTLEYLKQNITSSFEQNKEFISKNANQFFILSGGFKDLIIPITNKFKIPEAHIFANGFKFDKLGNVIGVDENNLLAQEKGKVKTVRWLKGLKVNGFEPKAHPPLAEKVERLGGKIYVIGDGYSDYEIFEAGLCDKFFAFTENVTRVAVTSKAEDVVGSLDELMQKISSSFY
ncbi:hypothetical protein KBD45_06735 [Candidatus Dojkabacteria bacterium]|nr:hypothetical protein [Candidatus Dojkabacteria bacterium]